MKKTLKNLTTYLLLLFVSVGLIAQLTTPVASAASCPSGRGFLGLPTWWRDLPCGSDGRPSISKVTDVWKIVLNVIEAAMILAGYTAVGFVIWGGFKYVASDGDEGKLTSGRKIITHALIGLALVFASVAIVNFVAGIL